MNWPLARNLLRRNVLYLFAIAIVYFATCLAYLSFLDDLLAQVLVASFLVAPVAAATIANIGPGLFSDWARVTFLLPLDRSSRTWTVYLARVVVPALLVWVTGVMVLGIIPPRPLSPNTALMALAVPFAASACWFLLSAARGGGYWTCCSRRGRRRKTLTALRMVAFAGLPILAAEWVDLARLQLLHGVALLVFGAVFSWLALREYHAVSAANVGGLVEARPMTREQRTPSRRTLEFGGFIQMAAESCRLGALYELPIVFLALLIIRVLQMALVLQGSATFFVVIVVFAVLAVHSILIPLAIFNLRAVRALPLYASQLSLRLSTLAAFNLLVLSLGITLATLVLFDFGTSLAVFYQSLAFIGISVGLLLPTAIYGGSNVLTWRQSLIIIPVYVLTVVWYTASSTLLADYLPVAGVTVAVAGFLLSWVLIRLVLVRSSRAYSTNEPLSPEARLLRR